MARAAGSILSLFILLTAAKARAGTFYVDAVSGRDDNDGATEGRAWQTLAGVSTPAAQAKLAANDRVLFRRGQTFEGSLVVTKSGTAGAPITYGAFGDGSKPTLSGFVTATDWAASGDGVWVSTCSLCAEPPRMVTLDDAPVALGRYPNADAPNAGFLTFEAQDKNSWIIDDQLTDTPNWTGAELVIRKMQWVIDRNRISNHSGSRITYVPSSGYDTSPGFGYFIQNDRKTLDALGEWYFDRATKRLYVYFGAAGPGGHVVRVAVVDTVIVANGQQHVAFEGLAVVGANRRAINAAYTESLRVSECEVRHTGETAFYAPASKRAVLERSTIAWTHDNAVDLFSEGLCEAPVVEGNVVRDTGTFSGMGGSNDGHHQAITSNCDGARIERNIIERTGYTAINFQGSDVLIKDNFIDRFDLVKDDGGGIYSYSGIPTPKYTGRRVVGNIVLRGIGQPGGTSHSTSTAHGIYLDDYVANVEVTGNTVAHHAGGGIFLHNTRDIVLRGNTSFDAEQQLLIITNVNPKATLIPGNLTVRDNLFVARTANQLAVMLEYDEDESAALGNFDGNRYARPVDDAFTFVRWVRRETHAAFDLPRWTRRYGHDKSSSSSAIRIAPYKIASLGANLFPNGAFDKNVDYAGAWSPASNARVSWTADGKLDGGAMRYSFEPPSSAPNACVATFGTGPVSSSQSYLLRFSGVASGDMSFASLLRQGDTGVPLGRPTFGGLSTLRSEQELVLTTKADSDKPAVALTFNEADAYGPFVIDNFGLFPAELQVTDTAKAFRLEYNAGTEARTFTLDEPYLDVAGAQYAGAVTLAPRGSLVLVKASMVTSPVITSPDKAIGTVGTSFHYQIVASNAPTSFDATGLPPGLTLERTSGVIAGTPTVVGTSTIPLSAFNAHGKGMRVLTLSVTERSTGVPSDVPSDGNGPNREHDPAGSCSCTLPRRGTGTSLLVVLGMVVSAFAVGRPRLRR